ncbi:uncharacterized protein LOC126559991 [Anopheles maculipalpis]|uniref:uncharacterized protein LOC126559991 n=1 Tax=Anopheles maculipalpis TaxID=1496333 RepID=UPI002158B43A|nr:uncharacterized protein LOC126559991 [Anopheles maculipalpis]
MKLSFETRFCTLPVSASWTFPLNYIPLSTSSASSEICPGWLPLDPPDVRIFLRSCSLLLLINNIATLLILLLSDAARAETHQNTKILRYVHYILIAWQTHLLLALGYIYYRMSNYHQVLELVHLLPMCLMLLFLDTCNAVTFYRRFRTIRSILFRTIVIVFRAIAWLTLLLSLTCAIHREYNEYNFVT